MPSIDMAKSDERDNGGRALSLQIREANDGDRAAWSAFVASRPEADILQAWAWGQAGTPEAGESWSRLLVVDGSGAVRGVAQVMARASSMGRSVLYVPHGPVWDREGSDQAAVLAQLLMGLRAHGRERRGVVLKLDPRASDDIAATEALRRALLAAGATEADHDLQAPTTRIVDLIEDEALLATWTSDARSKLRRADREGTEVTVDREGRPEALDDFYSILADTAERGDFRIRSREFFAALAEPLVASGDWFLSLARFEGTPLAGMIAPRTGDRAYYLYGASIRDKELGKKRGPHAALAGLMRALREDGTETLDMWGVREPDDETVDPSWEGFSYFKRQFGGTPLRHTGTFDIVIDPTWNRIRDWRERLRGAIR